MTKFSSITPSTTPTLADVVLGVQNPGSSPADVITTWQNIRNLLTLSAYNPYKFSAYNSTTQSLSSGTHKVIFDTEEYDTSNNYDSATNYRFTAPVAGFYTFKAALYLSSASTTARPFFQVNGVTTLPSKGIPFIANGSNSDVAFGGSADIKLNANDYVEIWATLSGSLTLQGYSGVQPITSFFQGRFLSAT